MRTTPRGTKRAATILREAERSPDAHLEDLQGMLEAASVEPEAGERLRTGTIERTVRPSSGFGPGLAVVGAGTSAAAGPEELLPGPSACRGSRLLPASANGCPAFGQYRPDPAGGHAPWAIQVLEVSGGRIAEMHFFLASLAPDRLFPAFGLPLHLDP